MEKVIINDQANRLFAFLIGNGSNEYKKAELVDFFNQYVNKISNYKRCDYNVTEQDIDSLKELLKNLPNNNQNIALIKLVTSVCNNFNISSKNIDYTYSRNEDFAEYIFLKIDNKIKGFGKDLIQQFPEAFPFVNSAFSSQRHNHSQNLQREV